MNIWADITIWKGWMLNLINEKERAEELLRGVPFKKEYFSTAYRVLVKYFHWKGYSASEIRKNIVEWEKKCGHKRYFDLNKIIMFTKEDNTNLFCDNFEIKISSKDIRKIKDKFDNKNIQKIALALLCFAKKNRSNEIFISLPALAQFTDISYHTIRLKYIKELIFFNYIEKIEIEEAKWGWDDDDDAKDVNKLKLKLLLDFEYDGEYTLNNNNFSEFSKILN